MDDPLLRTAFFACLTFCPFNLAQALVALAPPTDNIMEGSTRGERTPTHAWCCTATLENQKPLFDSVIGDGGAQNAFLSRNGVFYDMTASSDWMEWIEVTEERGGDEGGAGAYDTLRFDLMVQEAQNAAESPAQPRYTIWGEEFHVKRLGNSFQSLLEETRDNLAKNAIQVATEESHHLLRALVQHSQNSPFLKRNCLVAPGGNLDQGHTWIQLVKLTLLWSLSKHGTDPPSIVVRGHVCSSAKPTPVYQSTQPIVVTLAARRLKKADQHDVINDAQIDPSLPTRLQNPQSKVASWCKRRKIMDSTDTYKPVGVSEVIMVRPAKGEASGHTLFSLELLEGLSSNVFVIYNDGTLRTPRDGVLYGYVRHLVLQSAEKCGLRVDTVQPIRLEDAMEGKWSEVFITSSSRLIWPVSRILLPTSEAKEYCGDRDNCEIDGFHEFWNDPVFTVPGSQKASPRWQKLLEEILLNAGYEL